MKQMMILLALCLSVTIMAQTADEAIQFLDNESGFGHKAQALGNSFTAVADDYSAIFWNPAGLTQLKKSEVHGAYQLRQDQNEISFLGNVQNGEWNFQKLKSLGMAYKFPTVQGSFVLAFGFQRLHDYDEGLNFSGFSQTDNGQLFDVDDGDGNWTTLPFGQDIQQSEEIAIQGNLNSFSIGSGIMLSPKLSVGATFHFYRGNHFYEFDYQQFDSEDEYNIFPGDFNQYGLYQTIDTELKGHGLTVGTLLNLSPDLKAGLAIDLPWRLTASEVYYEEEYLTFDDGYEENYEPIDGEWTYVIRYPAQIRGGLCLDLPKLMLTAGFGYRDWRDVRFEAPDDYTYVGDYDYLMDENPVFKTDYRPVLSYHFGGEFRIPNSGLKLRGGYRMVPSVYQDADASWNRTYWTGGVAWDLDDSSTVHLTAVRGEWKRLSMDGLASDATLENIQSTRLLVGLTYRL